MNIFQDDYLATKNKDEKVRFAIMNDVVTVQFDLNNVFKITTAQVEQLYHAVMRYNAVKKEFNVQ
jgi:hypothetical protein